MKEKNFGYPKHEKLKSKIAIEKLFSEGKSVAKYPLRLVFCETAATETQLIKMGISVSKKYFKKAVDRNYLKRVLRETYRLNKHILTNNLKTPHAFMFFYQSKEVLDYKEIADKTVQLFEKFVGSEAHKEKQKTE